MSNRGRNWQQFDYTYPITISASQLETFAGDVYDPQTGEVEGGCNRKWMFEKVWKLPKEDKEYLKIGDVLHEVCERFLLADQTGRGPDGKPLELYPDGWDIELSYEDAALIKMLVAKAIETGMLRRSPQRVIEKPFQVQVLDDRQASIIGYIDVATPYSVEDHKSTKSTRWAKTREGLRNNVQMLVYAAVQLRDWYKEKGDIETFKRNGFTLRHNIFIKGSPPNPRYKSKGEQPGIRPVEVKVAADVVVKFWEDVVVASARKMLHLKRMKLKPEDYSKVDGPKTQGVCKKYGGCAFAGICGGTETVDEYKTRITRFNANSATEESPMALFDKLKKKKEAREKAGGVASAEAPAEAPAPVTEPETRPEAVDLGAVTEETVDDIVIESDGPLTVAPWGFEGCQACGGRGLTSKGAACKPCVLYQEKAGGPKVADYRAEAIEGFIMIYLKEDGKLISQIPVVVGEAKVTENTKPEAAPPAPPATEAPKGTKKAVEPEAKKNKPGRPRRGFVMVYGVQKRGKEKTIDLTQVLQKYGNELAEAMGASSYYGLDTWKRRDWLALKAGEIAETFGPAVVMVTSRGPDIDAFATALEPFAADVYVGA